MSDVETPILPEMTSAWQELGWQPSAEQRSQFQHLYELVVAGNRQLNLTRNTDPSEFWEKHLWDSLRGIAPLLKSEFKPDGAPAELSGQRVVDIGTGAGFPGIPVAIAQPDWTVTLLDSTYKKIAFLQTLLTTLGISNAITLTNRAEQAGQHPEHRETYDIALIRAVGPASVCAEYALPLLKMGGVAVLYRGQWTEDEMVAFQPVVERLGGQIESIEGFTTPLSQSMRHCLYLRKTQPTPVEFPRPTGLPAQHPL